MGGIVRQRAYSGTLKVTIGGDVIERVVPAIVTRNSRSTPAPQNKRRPNREGNRRYLLAGLVRCETCGYGCSGHATWGKGKRYSYYTGITNKPRRAVSTAPHRVPSVRAEWLEETVWADIREFLVRY